MLYQFRPLESWPTAFTKARRRSTFGGNYTSTIKLLGRELEHLKAQTVVIQAAIAGDDIRNDGLLRSSARPRHPGIIVSFETKAFGPLSYPCDTYTEWDQNLRAIALALEALRRVERYGVTRRGEQYQGWAKLPPPAAAASMGLSEATSTLCAAAGLTSYVHITGLNFESLRRMALVKSHPDTGGSPEEFKRLQAALVVIEKSLGAQS